MRIFYGQDLYTDHRIETLFFDQLIGVASPAFMAEHGNDVAKLHDRHFIHTDWGQDYASSPNWSGAIADGRIIDHAAGLRVGASSIALGFARASLGTARHYLDIFRHDLGRGPPGRPHSGRVAR